MQMIPFKNSLDSASNISAMESIFLTESQLLHKSESKILAHSLKPSISIFLKRVTYHKLSNQALVVTKNYPKTLLDASRLGRKFIQVKISQHKRNL